MWYADLLGSPLDQNRQDCDHKIPEGCLHCPIEGFQPFQEKSWIGCMLGIRGLYDLQNCIYGRNKCPREPGIVRRLTALSFPSLQGVLQLDCRWSHDG